MRPGLIFLFAVGIPVIMIAQDPIQQKIDSLKLRLDKTPQDSTRFPLLHAIASRLLASHPEEAQKYFEQILQHEQCAVTGSWRMDALMGVGNTWYYRGDFPKARTYYSEASRLAIAKGDSSKYALSLNNIGLTFINQGDLSQGLDFQLRSAAITERSGDKRGLAMNYNAIGVIYLELSNLHDNLDEQNSALEYLKRALELSRSASQQTLTISVLNNIGNIYKDKKQFDRALEYLLQSLQLSSESGNKSAEATALTNLGSIFDLQDLKEKAEEYYLKALAIHRELNDNHGTANNLHALGVLQMKKNQLRAASEYLGESLALAETTKENALLSNIYLALAEVAEKEGNYLSAYRYFKQHHALDDSLSNEEYARNLNEMKTRFDTETQKKENELLQKESEFKSEQLSGQRRIIFVISGGLLVVLVLSFFIYKGYTDKRKANELLASQKQIIEEKNKDITDSIRYASRIQSSILPSPDKRKDILGEHSIFFRPRDIVSGDFYWMEKHDDKLWIAVADCTGHGVPGALMSMIGNGALNEILRNDTDPATGSILDHLRDRIIQSLEQKNETTQKDGMDIAIVKIDRGSGNMQFSGANNPAWLIRSGQCLELLPDKMPAGIHAGEERPFHSETVQIKAGDVVFLFTDGFADQFGGPAGKKFKYKALKELFCRIAHLSPASQEKEMKHIFDDWKGSLEQVDDVCVIGIKIQG